MLFQLDNWLFEPLAATRIHQLAPEVFHYDSIPYHEVIVGFRIDWVIFGYEVDKFAVRFT